YPPTANRTTRRHERAAHQARSAALQLMRRHLGLGSVLRRRRAVEAGRSELFADAVLPHAPRVARPRRVADPGPGARDPAGPGARCPRRPGGRAALLRLLRIAVGLGAVLRCADAGEPVAEGAVRLLSPLPRDAERRRVARSSARRRIRTRPEPRSVASRGGAD